MVEQKYYPLIDIQNKNEVVCVENLFSNEELSKIISIGNSLEKLKGFVGEVEAGDIETVRKSNINFLDHEDYNWIYNKLCIAKIGRAHV